jgi:hypothetical protein
MADGLAGALAGLNYTPQETAYGIAGGALNQLTPQIITPYTSTGRAVGIGLGSILLQSLLGYQARQEAVQQSLETNRLANQLMTFETPEQRTGFIEQLPSGGFLDPRERLLTLATALNQQETARKAKAAEKLAEMTAGYEAQLGVEGTKVFEREQNALLNRALALRAPTGGGAGRGGSSSQTTKPFGALPLLEGGNALQAKLDALIARGIQMGMTPNQAAQYAEKNIRVDRKATDAAQKVIDESRQRAGKLEQVATTARAGVEGAGLTGGVEGGIREFASKAYAFVSPSEQEQRDYQKILDSVRPNVINMLKSPGAVSDFESNLLMGSGPSSVNTPTENKKLIEGMETIANLESDYADFVEAYITEKGSSVGADALWRQYKSEQVFPEGKYNPMRADWASWLSERGMAPEPAIVGPVQDEKLQILKQLQAEIAAERAKRGR